MARRTFRTTLGVDPPRRSRRHRRQPLRSQIPHQTRRSCRTSFALQRRTIRTPRSLPGHRRISNFDHGDSQRRLPRATPFHPRPHLSRSRPRSSASARLPILRNPHGLPRPRNGCLARPLALTRRPGHLYVGSHSLPVAARPSRSDRRRSGSAILQRARCRTIARPRTRRPRNLPSQLRFLEERITRQPRRHRPELRNRRPPPCA